MSSSRFEEPDRQSPGFVLWHLTVRWERAVTAALRPFGLTHPQFVLLACTYWANIHGASPSQVDVARQAGLDPKAVSPVLRRLEKAQLVTRQMDPTDSRARRLAVTRRGRNLAAKTIAVVEQVDDEFFADLPPQFRATVLSCGTDPANPGQPRGDPTR